MNALLQAAAELQKFCDDHNWRMCFIGGLAVQRWGEPRFTKDADVTLLTGFGDEQPYIDELLSFYESRVESAKDFALANRVLLLKSRRGVPLDIALGALPFEEHAIDRASRFKYAAGCVLNTCCAEDLIVHKAFAGRPQDWLDIETILSRQMQAINLRLVSEELRLLAELKEDAEVMPALRNLARKILGEKAAGQIR